MFDVDYIVANLQVAEVGKKRGDLRLMPLRTRNNRFGFVKQIASAEDRQVSFREHHTFGDVRLRQCGGQHFAREVGSFVGIALAPTSAAAQPKGNAVLTENVSQAFDLTRVGDGNQHPLTFRNLFLDFFQHRRN